MHRKRKQEELERVRKAEEELMEDRRRQLLAESNGYWKQRLEQEEAHGRALLQDFVKKSFEVRSFARCKLLPMAIGHEIGFLDRSIMKLGHYDSLRFRIYRESKLKFSIDCS